MDKKNMGVAAVATIAIVIVLAASFVMLGNDNGDVDDTETIKFLIQDDKGVYFWVEGEGDTAIAAFENAIGQDVYKDAAAFVPSTDKDTGASNGIQSLYGVDSAQDAEGNWSWWQQFTWNGSEWEASSLMMDKYGFNESEYIAVVFSTLGGVPAVTPADVKIWDQSQDGTVFTIESSSGLTFQVNGEGTTVYDAFKDATVTYSIPFEPSKDAAGVEYGINSLYGLEMYQDGATWYYWSQYVWADGVWDYATTSMNGLASAENPVFKIVYAGTTF